MKPYRPAWWSFTEKSWGEAVNMKVLMIVQEPVITRRILQEARSLIDAGHNVSILSRAGGTEDRAEEVDGIPVEWVAVRGRDPRFGWLYRLVGTNHGSNAAALWSVLSMRHTFTLRALARAVAAKADVYHAHDLNNLELACHAAAANGARVVYDSHELFTELGNRWIQLRRKAWARLESKLIKQAEFVVTVNEFIGDELSNRYGVPAPLVVMNCPDPPSDFDPMKGYNVLRERLGLSPDRKIVLYQGWMSEGRGLENLVRCAPLLAGEAAVVFIGYGEYQEALARIALEEAPGRVYFLPAVSHRELLPYCASADVGLIPYQAVDLNNYYSSPNKLFDYIQAGLPIVASDFPFLRKVIATDNLGVVAELSTPESYASAINQVLTLPDGGDEIRANMRRAAPRYTWQSQARGLVLAYEKLSAGQR
ncbi:MAG: glycosyltransferase family 4 protein [Chloroflexota bacterium]|nr:glycosyltransferase family 4 protein [Chloroflexota bacterium]